ncbi:tRNA (adenine(58)-N(1))-methyltransferase non-catalytic subunit TRM6 [Acyrthosiphon pisum]|uniref:tRNA (adenine(58)-N(1))-methyltransferase non-catalytic subunit TRM6 n=1 Tax=Acyrthosiphon pisum TaxID=7029 RepID=A0A8R2A3C3_ACYPI|nr:tRNA (adenine(58)-N(1))-methyltransferase non-catalytic subunit TRM6 [Acyrthosiphon pisum]|eukprot:XP_001952015.2 PREDICTED: tRNA (adenine(58)-N(1))-methyltransferase non-catalytic subunit TRM6 [Acyrthosiphon pisum]
MMAKNLENIIARGHYLIINKNETYLIHQISNKAILKLGRDVIDLKAAIGQPFSSTYKLEPMPEKKRHYSLVICNDNQVRNQWSTNGCGTDNKLITDDSSSQLLSTDEIIALKESGESGQNIVERLLENSKTFQLKTEYAQEKYLKKKARKYCDYLTIFKPSIRLITDVLYKQQTLPKTIALRFDTLAQILCRVNLDPGGKYLLYENGSQGLLQAALLNQLHDNGCLVHIFSSTSEQNALRAVKAMNFSETKIKQMLTVSLDEILNTKNEDNIPAEKDEEDVPNCSDEKKRKSDEAYTQIKKKHRPITSTDGLNFIKSNKFDGLIVVCREEPTEFVKTLLPYLSLSRPFVIYSAYREVLVTIYAEFKMRRDVVFLRLTDNFMRYHQVLPNRTHPDVTMDDGGGFLFSGLFVAGTK